MPVLRGGSALTRTNTPSEVAVTVPVLDDTTSAVTFALRPSTDATRALMVTGAMGVGALNETVYVPVTQVGTAPSMPPFTRNHSMAAQLLWQLHDNERVQMERLRDSICVLCFARQTECWCSAHPGTHSSRELMMPPFMTPGKEW